MAIGFGKSMIGSPLVIMWPNHDGTITLSQRQTDAHAEPQVVSNPSRVAKVRTDLSSLTGSTTVLSFSVPSSGQSDEHMIYALSPHRPASNAVTATLQKHSVNDAFQLGSTQTNGRNSAHYTSTERKFVAHGILSALGFCFFLPIGVLQLRFLRLWWPNSFSAHWIVMAGLGEPCIIVGFALAVRAVQENGTNHFADKHMIIGLVLFLLYICQSLYGSAIHLAKRPYHAARPAQNYGHAVLGLGVIALALFQVWLGFNVEWTKATGRDKPERGLKIFWAVWAGVLGAAYILGLTLLPKQYRVERWAAQAPEDLIKSDCDRPPHQLRHGGFTSTANAWPDD